MLSEQGLVRSVFGAFASGPSEARPRSRVPLSQLLAIEAQAGAPRAASYTATGDGGGGALLTVTVIVWLALLPARSVAVARSEWLPLATGSVFQLKLQGEALDWPIATPSSARASSDRPLVGSLPRTWTSTVPETVWAAAGAV